MMEPFLQQATLLGTMIICAVIMYNYNTHIKKTTQDQADKFNKITSNFNATISELNITITKLTTTLDFIEKESTALHTRLSKHGEEIDGVSKHVAILEDRQQAIVKRLDIVERKSCIGLQNAK